MKKLIFGIGFILLSCSGEGVEANAEDPGNDTSQTDGLIGYNLDENRLSAVEFNNEVTISMSSAINMVDELFRSDSATIDLNLENAIFEMEIQIGKLESLTPPDDGVEFRNSVIRLLEFYREEFKGDFQATIPLIKKGNLSKSEQAQIDAYDKEFADQERELSDSIYAHQDEFAAKNNIKLTDQ